MSLGLQGAGSIGVVGLALDAHTTEPLSGRSVVELAEASAGSSTFRLVHGADDRVVAPSDTEQLAEVLRRRGHEVSVTRCPTDHAGIVMARYDSARRRCLPSRSRAARVGGDAALRALLAATRSAAGVT